MKISFSYVFDRKNKTNKPSDIASIELRAYCNAKTVYVSTKIAIHKSEWNDTALEINKRHSDSELLNKRLKQIISDLEHEQSNRFFRKKPFLLDDVKAYFQEKKVNSDSYIDFVKDELINDNVLSPKTKLQHTNTLTKLKTFKKSNDVLFSDLNFAFIDEFLNHLRGLGYLQNTVYKHYKNIKKFIEIGIKKGKIETSNPCKEIKIRGEEKPRDVLILSEINTISTLLFEQHDYKLECIRDMFLFAVYTGLRISDVQGLKLDYIEKIELGYALNFISFKSKKHVKLPLYMLFPLKESNSKPELILMKYLIPNSVYLFPRKTDQYINRQLKIIAEMAEIKFNLTFHIARETFGTYMAQKVPLPVLRNLMQHTDIKTTMMYVHLNEQMIKDQLIKTNWDN